MKQKRNRLFKLLMSAVFALGTLSSAAPALANEDTSFEETMISDTFNETEQTSTGFEEMEEDETQPDLEEESAEAGDLITGQLPQPDMNIKETARSAEKIMRTTDRKYAAERNILVDEGIPGISNQYFPPNTPIWRDDRKKVTNTRKFPNYAICKLYMTFEDKRGE